MIVSKDKNNISKLVFIVSLLMLVSRKYLTTFFFDYEWVYKVQSLLLYAPIALLLAQFMMNKYHTKKEIFLLSALSLLYILTKEGSILIFILMGVGVKSIEDDYIVKGYFNVHMILFISYITLALVFPDAVSQGDSHYRFENGIRVIRGDFGLSNPNAAFYYLLPVYASYIYLRFDKYNIIDRVFMIVLTLLIYNVTDSRTGLIAVAGGLITVELLKFIDIRKYKFISKVVKLIPLIFSLMSILIGTILHNSEFLNKVLSSRPKNWYIYLVSRGNMLSLFGNRYSEGVRNVNPMDNSYIYILCFLGIIAFVLLMYVIYKGLEGYIRDNQNKYIAIAMLFFIYAVAENILLEVSLNFTLLLIIKKFMTMDNDKLINIYNIKNYSEEIIYIKSFKNKRKNRK